MQKADSGVWRQELLCGPEDSDSVAYRQQRGYMGAALRPWQLRNAPPAPSGALKIGLLLVQKADSGVWRQELLCGPEDS